MKIKYATFISFLILNSLPIDIYGQLSNNNKIISASSTEINNLKEELFYNLYPQIEFHKFINLLANNIEESSSNNSKELNNFQIISNKQLRSDDIFIAEGNVVVQNGSSILISERFEYNFKLKTISVKGNIKFNSKEQFFEASELRYDLNKKIGFIKDIFGSINFDSLELIKLKNDVDPKINEDVFEDTKVKNVKLNSISTLGFKEIDLKEDGKFIKKVTSQKFILELNDPQKWRFKSKRVDINNNEWNAEKLILTNDPFNIPQLVIKNKGFKSTNLNGEITLKSKWSTIVLDNKISVPAGPRRYKIDEDNLVRWGIEYNNDSKDGIYITRNFDKKIFGKEKKTKLNLKKEFYLQRALIGKTKSFSDKNQSILASKSERDAEFLDYFGLKGSLKTKLKNFNFNSDFSLNSLNPEFFSKSFKNKSEITKTLYSKDTLNSKKESKLTFFGNYRDKVWNGSLGEREIISAYGLKISKSNQWIDNNIIKSSMISGSYGDYKSSDRIDVLKIINKERLNILFERSHSYPIWRVKKNNFINSENIYSPEVIASELNLNAQGKVDLYRYSDNNFQNLFIFRAGPELTLGNFQKNLFDYSKISLYHKTELSYGNSPFGFDQSADQNTIEFNIKQQLFGPLTFDFKTEYNLDNKSNKYKEFYNTQYDLTWNRRAYSIGIYYNYETKAGGFNFKINSFNFEGYGNKF